MKQSIKYNGSAKITVTNVNEGFTFKGWYYNGIEMTPETTIEGVEQVVVNNEEMKLDLIKITANITGITAEFTDGRTFEVEANANPQEGGTITIESSNE